MEKFLRKWLRRLHRWLAIPIFALLLVVIFSHGTNLGATAQRIQQPIMLVMAITGSYLFLLPYLTKWKRGKTSRTE